MYDAVVFIVVDKIRGMAMGNGCRVVVHYVFVLSHFHRNLLCERKLFWPAGFSLEGAWPATFKNGMSMKRSTSESTKSAGMKIVSLMLSR